MSGTERFLLRAESETGGGRPEVGALTGSVTELRYRADSQKRIYLVRDDLNIQLDPILGPIEALHFPYSPSFGTERVVPVGTDQDWDSLRVYDIGACSLHLPWGILQAQLNTGIVRQLQMDPNVGGPVATGPTGSGALPNVGPILDYDDGETADELRYDGFITAGSSFGCQAVIIDFEARYQTGSVEVTTRPDRCGGEVPLPSPQTDLTLTALEGRAEVRDFCIVEDQVENGVIAALNDDIPGGFAAVMRVLSEIDTAILGLDTTPCVCDAECQTPDSPRGACFVADGEQVGVCRFAAEIDRVMLMPEGATFVYSESIATDNQGGILLSASFEEALLTNLGSPGLLRLLGAQYGCGAARAPFVAPGDPPMRRDVRAVFDAPSL